MDNHLPEPPAPLSWCLRSTFGRRFASSLVGGAVAMDLAEGVVAPEAAVAVLVDALAVAPVDPSAPVKSQVVV